MSYVLHYAPDNASLIIRLALDHAGISFTTALVDRKARAQESAAFRKLNPVGLIPVLETSDGAIFETGAILTWLSERHDGIGPKPGTLERADFLRWLFFTANTLHPALRIMFYPEKCIEEGATAKLRAGSARQISAALKNLEQMAASAPDWLRHSALPFYIAACLRWCALYPRDADKRWFELNDTPSLAKLCAHLETLPATAKLQSAEGLGPTPFTAPHYPNPPEGSAT